MSGAMRKIGEYLGLLEDTGRYPEDEGYDEYDEPPARDQGEESAPATVKAKPATRQRDRVAGTPKRQREASVCTFGSLRKGRVAAGSRADDRQPDGPAVQGGPGSATPSVRMSAERSSGL